jgi:hypothetical protein
LYLLALIYIIISSFLIYKNFQERKTKFVSLRNEFKENLDQNNHINYISSLNSANTLINENNNQKTYLNTQNMFESSLSEELSIFDFTSNSFMKVSRKKKFFYYIFELYYFLL